MTATQTIVKQTKVAKKKVIGKKKNNGNKRCGECGKYKK